MIIYQLKNGYRYNSDTIMLYHFTKSLKPKGKILEVGAGSGVLGLLLARDLKGSDVTLLDIQKENIELCIKNSKINGIKCDIIEADYKTFKSKDRFDLIVSNPPYYHDGVRKSQNEHLSISRYASNLGLDSLIKNSSSHLKSHGSLVFCYDAKQLMYISHLLLENKFSMTKLKFIYPKSGKNAKVVMVEAKKSSKSLCDILQSIYLSDDTGYSKEAYSIFKEANLESVDI